MAFHSKDCSLESLRFAVRPRVPLGRVEQLFASSSPRPALTAEPLVVSRAYSQPTVALRYLIVIVAPGGLFVITGALMSYRLSFDD